MPELPEVETVRAGLERHVLGALVSRVDVLHPRPVRRDAGGPEGFAAALVGRRILAARRRGKYLWLPLDDGAALLAHLGMSGQLLVQPREAPPSGTSGCGWCSRVTPRRDASCASSTSGCSVGCRCRRAAPTCPAEIAHIARDPLDEAFDDDEFVARVRRRSSGIKRLLLDQGLISGVGNIYADEALWRAGLHGERPGERLTKPQVRRLLEHAREVMSDALDQGGTSFDALYVNVNGESGYFDRSLNAYGRQDEPCRRCGTPIKRVAFMNRSSYFCPRCQPAPRRSRPAA